MLYHYSAFLGDGIVASGYLAVDLFFVLSGFVIAYAYDDRLRHGLGTGMFLRLRLVRLYPVYIAGCLIGLGFVLVRNVVDPSKFSEWKFVGEAVIRTALFLPDLSSHDTLVGLFPFDQAAWSLSLEMGVNILYVLLFRVLSTRVLVAIVACSAIVLAVTVATFGTIDMGSTTLSLYGGVERCLFGFPAGVLLFRLRGRRWPMPRHTAAVLLAFVVIWLAVPTAGHIRIVHDIVSGLILVPLLVWLGGWVEDVPQVRLLGWLAGISYPVYIFHTPVVWTLEWLTVHLLHRHPEDLKPVSGLVFAAVIIVLSDLTVRYYEAPLFRLLRQGRFSRRVAVPLGS